MNADDTVYIVSRITPTLTVVERGLFLMTDGVRVAYRPMNSHGECVALVRCVDKGDVFATENEARRETGL